MRIAVALTLFLAAATSAAAGDWVVDGRIYLSASPDAFVPTIEVDAGVEFEFYIVADVGEYAPRYPRQISGLEGRLQASQGIVIQTIEWPDTAVDVAAYLAEPDAANFIVGLGQCYYYSPQMALGVVTAIVLGDGEDLEIGVAGIPVGSSAPSSFEGQGPGWVACHEPNQLRMFEMDGEDESLAVNPTGVPNEHHSFGEIKALY